MYFFKLYKFNKFNKFFNELANYLQGMNEVNFKARHISKNTALQTYKNNIQKITKKEKELLYYTLNNLINSSRNDISKFINAMLNKVKFIKYKSGFYNGLPHTHNGYIIFPEFMYKNPMSHLNTIVHEFVHIHQRFEYSKYQYLYKLIGFISTSNIENFKPILNVSRYNPDEDRNNLWVWKNPYTENTYYWIGAVYNSETPTSLLDVTYKAYPLERKSESNFLYNNKNSILLREFDSFNTYFGINVNHYHPNEIVAEYMTLYYENTSVNTKAYQLFLTKFIPILNK